MLKTFSITDIGVRRNINQDFVFSSEKPVGRLPNLFIVADGMGGHKAGDFASRQATQTIVECLQNSTQENTVTAIRSAIEQANETVIAKAAESESFEGMGTTVVLATIFDNTMYVANVGDSRLYLEREDLKQITKDHSLVEEMVRMGGIDQEAARYHPKKNVITRAVGGSDEIQIDFFEIQLAPGDVILMCSDGLTNMVEDGEISLILRKQRDVVEMAETLVRTANENGGTDNVSVIIIKKE